MIHSINIATWNISECVTSFWDLQVGVDRHAHANHSVENMQQILEHIRSLDIDVICFQEYPVRIHGKPVLRDLIVGYTDLVHCYERATYPGFLLRDSEIGVSVFSRFSLEDSSFSFFENPNITIQNPAGQIYRTFDKGLITTWVNTGRSGFTLITGHAISFSPFGISETDYPGSFQEILRCVNRTLPHSRALVFTGDFNTQHLPEILPTLNKTLTDWPTGPTTVSGEMEGADFGDGRKLDYFMTGGKIRVEALEKHPNFSDHILCLFRCGLLD